MGPTSLTRATSRGSSSICSSRPSSGRPDRKSTRLNSSHDQISYAVFCLKKKNKSVRAEGHTHELQSRSEVVCPVRHVENGQVGQMLYVVLYGIRNQGVVIQITADEVEFVHES